MTHRQGWMDQLYTFLEWFTRFSVINILWLMFSVPTVLVFFMVLIESQIEVIIILLLPLFLFIPLFLVPATTAMFGVARGWVLKDRESYMLIKSYWYYYRENYKRSLANGIILAVLWGVWFADIYFFYGQHNFLFIFFLLMGTWLFVFSINLFSLTVHYKMSFLAIIKNTFFMTVSSPGVYLWIIVSSTVIVFLSIKVLPILFVLCMGSLIAYLSFRAFHHKYMKIVQGESK